MEMLLIVLMEWLSTNTSMTIEQPPQVVIMSHNDLQKKYNWTMHAVYNRQEKIIYLSEHIDVNTPIGASVVLHELVHHYQNISGLVNTFQCSQQSEKLAYETQRLYLLDKNVAELMPELNAFNITMLSRCSMP